jgi:hypothetical protein
MSGRLCRSSARHHATCERHGPAGGSGLKDSEYDLVDPAVLAKDTNLPPIVRP